MMALATTALSTQPRAYVTVLLSGVTVHTSGTISAGPRAIRVQQTCGSRIVDENGSEVMWRSTGGSYLFQAEDYKTAWEKHLPEIQKMGINTMRLAFAFSDSSPDPQYGTPTADILNLSKLDWILDFLDRKNIKAILDCHNFGDMNGDFGSQKLIDGWTRVAQHYRGDSRIAAYELFNEPMEPTWDRSSVNSKEDVARAYATLTQEVRKWDPEHIVIWLSQPDTPPIENMSEFLQPNMVITVHTWCKKSSWELQVWTPEQISNMTVSNLVECRKKYDLPFWLGEICSSYPYDSSNPGWVSVEPLLWGCEEQVIGWDLWDAGINYLPFFPLKIYNQNLTRATWQTVPTFAGYIAEWHGVEVLEPCRIQMWHGNDYVTFRPGITIQVVATHRLSDGTFEVASNEKITVSGQLTICNEEGTQSHSGDWNMFVYPVS